MITNQSKPASTTDAKLNIGSAYNLIVGGVYELLIGIGGGSFVNQSKVSIGETWDTITTSWATETRTWLAASQLITNATLSATDPLWSSRTLPWSLSTPWQNTNAGIINENKP